MQITRKMRLRQHALRAAILPLRLVAPRGYFAGSGWYRSLNAASPIDQAGDPVPWWSYAATDFVADRIQSDMKVLEFGSGHSTLWIAARAESVLSFEADEHWIERLHSRLPANAEINRLHGSAPDRYKDMEFPHHARDGFDVIIVDGLDRLPVVRECHRWLNDTGVIIYDDFDPLNERRWETEARLVLEAQGFRQLAFRSLGPINDVPHSTTCFYRQQNCFQI